MLKIFVRFVLLLPYGQWAFGESRVQKNIHVNRIIRVREIFVFKILLVV